MKEPTITRCFHLTFTQEEKQKFDEFFSENSLKPATWIKRAIFYMMGAQEYWDEQIGKQLNGSLFDVMLQYVETAKKPHGHVTFEDLYLRIRGDNPAMKRWTLEVFEKRISDAIENNDKCTWRVGKHWKKPDEFGKRERVGAIFGVELKENCRFENSDNKKKQDAEKTSRRDRRRRQTYLTWDYIEPHIERYSKKNGFGQETAVFELNELVPKVVTHWRQRNGFEDFNIKKDLVKLLRGMNYKVVEKNRGHYIVVGARVL